MQFALKCSQTRFDRSNMVDSLRIADGFRKARFQNKKRQSHNSDFFFLHLRVYIFQVLKVIVVKSLL